MDGMYYINLPHLIIGDGVMRKPLALIILTCILFPLILTGCTEENHRVIVTVKNLRDTPQEIRVDIDGDQKFTATLDPSEGAEREFELSKGDHTFELYDKVNGTYRLYKTETKYVEADDGVIFELE
jgi:hypothetical protein